MDCRRLEAFCKVYELKSFSRAGETLFLSQPTISAHVASLEQELGVRLFDRLGRQILPTVAAEVLYQHAQKAFQHLGRAKLEIQLLNDNIAGNLIIGGSTIPAHFLLPRIMARFLAQHPDVTIQLHIGDSQAVIHRVVSGELVLGLVGACEPEPDLSFLPLIQDELVIIAAPALDMEGSAYTLAHLACQPWVMREFGSGTRKAFELGLGEKGLALREFRIALTVESTHAVTQCVKAGLGLGITSRLAVVDALARKELVEVCAPELSMRRSFYCVYNERRHFFPATRRFIEFLQQETASCEQPAL